MIRLILHLFLFLFLSSYSCEAYRFSSSDQKVLNSFWKYAEEHRLGNLQRLSCKILSGSDTGMQRSSTILPVYTILQIGYMKCNKLIC